MATPPRRGRSSPPRPFFTRQPPPRHRRAALSTKKAPPPRTTAQAQTQAGRTALTHANEPPHGSAYLRVLDLTLPNTEATLLVRRGALEPNQPPTTRRVPQNRARPPHPKAPSPAPTQKKPTRAPASKKALYASYIRNLRTQRPYNNQRQPNTATVGEHPRSYNRPFDATEQIHHRARRWLLRGYNRLDHHLRNPDFPTRFLFATRFATQKRLQLLTRKSPDLR